MDHNDFVSLMPKLKKIPLPGEKAHKELIPALRNQLIKDLYPENNSQNAGVLALFSPDSNNQTHLVLILRKTYKGVHSGQIGFPGGKQELFDKNIEATCLRETKEEIGVRPSEVEIICPLSKLYIPPSNFWLYPFLGITQNTPQFKRQEREVEKILFINLEEFLNDQNFGTAVISASYAPKLKVPAFQLGGQTVWGATGMALNEIKYLLNRII